MAKREIILDITARTGDIQKRIREIDRALVVNRETLKQLNEDYKTGAITSKQYADATGNIKRESSDLRKEQRGLVKQIDTVTKATKAAEGSNEQLRAQLALLTKQYNSLSKEQRENTEDGRALQKQIRSLSDTLKKNEKALESLTASYRLSAEIPATLRMLAQVSKKLKKKGCDWILANDVAPGTARSVGRWWARCRTL